MPLTDNVNKQKILKMASLNILRLGVDFHRYFMPRVRCSYIRTMAGQGSGSGGGRGGPGQVETWSLLRARQLKVWPHPPLTPHKRTLFRPIRCL